MLTYEQRVILGDGYLIKIYQDLEKDIINNINNHMSALKKETWLNNITETVLKLRNMGYNTQQLEKELYFRLERSRTFTKIRDEIEVEYRNNHIRLIKNIENEREIRSVIKNTISYTYNNLSDHLNKKIPQNIIAVKNLSNYYHKKMKQDLKSIVKTTGIVSNNYGKTSSLAAFTKVLDKTLIYITHGNLSLDEAKKKAVTELAQAGISHIKYRTGYTISLDSAVRTILQTETAQLSADLAMQTCKDLSIDYVEIDSHSGARPEHAAWQGKVFRLDELEAKTGYKTVTGLCGINCRHNFYPYIPGTPRMEQAPKIETVTYMGKTYDYYDATQIMRKMERDIRKLRRITWVTYDPQVKKEIREKTRKYNNFCAQTGILPQKSRLYV